MWMVKKMKMNMIEMQMKNNYLLVKEISVERTTSAGLLLPEEKWKRRAEVLAVCADSQIRPGDTVIRNVGRGTPITIEGQQLEMIHEDWVMAIVE